MAADRRWWLILSLVVAIRLAPAASAICPGDCDGDGTVTVAETVLSVRIALALAPPDECPRADTDGDSRITIAELIRVVKAALSGCDSPVMPTPTPVPQWRFTEVSIGAGIDFVHAYKGADGKPGGPTTGYQRMAGGAAAGDFDGDGWLDLYAIGGDATRNYLYRNRGDGTFSEEAEARDAALPGTRGCGPGFADVDGDGDLDLFVGGVETTGGALLRNDGGRFVDVTEVSGLRFPRGLASTVGAAFADWDRDGDLDVATAHWFTFAGSGRIEHLYRNLGSGRFEPVTAELGVSVPTFRSEGLDFFSTFTPNFADVNRDGWPDLLLAADFGLSRVFLNQGGTGFADRTTPVISDENGMGAAVGDYDGDGDLDWFVSSIYDETPAPGGEWGISGNRLYRNRGDGTFEDVTDEAGVRRGFWGWGACMADFDNDGHLDVFHVNGSDYEGAQGRFQDTPAVLFRNRGDGTFEEIAGEVGVDDRGDGRGVVCFDYDRDGDVDVFISNNGGRPALYRNDLPRGRHFLTVLLRGSGGNTEGIGATVSVVTAAARQVREIQAGNNFASSNPAEAHFGLGSSEVVDVLEVRWPGGAMTVCRNVAADRMLVVYQERGDGCDAVDDWNPLLPPNGD